MTAVDLERVRRRVARDPVLAGAGTQRGPALRAAIARAVRAEQVLLDDRGLAAVVSEMTDLFTGLGPAERLLRDGAVTDVMINGPGDVWVERDGRLERTAITYPDAESLRAAVLRVVGPHGLRFDRAHPTVDTRLPDGSRLHAVGEPLAADGPLVTARKFATIEHSWEDLEAVGAVPVTARRLLQAAVTDRRAIVCCGRTGTGKTTPRLCHTNRHGDNYSGEVPTHQRRPRGPRVGHRAPRRRPRRPRRAARLRGCGELHRQRHRRQHQVDQAEA